MVIAYIDLETDSNNQKIRDIGAICGEKELHTHQIAELIPNIQAADFICGHNFLHHDFPHLRAELAQIHKTEKDIIDTLMLSPLLFPARPYHALDKDYKQAFEESNNNPLLDCRITAQLLENETDTFFRLPENLQTIFYYLLKDCDGFSAFFRAMGFQAAENEILAVVVRLIFQTFQEYICKNSPVRDWAKRSPVALAYALSLIHCNNRYSITPAWLVQQYYPEINTILTQLRGTPCETGCDYCREYLDTKKYLRKYFGYEKFRQYDNKPLQAQAAQAAVSQQSLLAVFPTGGGKSVTFQVPALMAGERQKALTVVISPLQSLMKDQVDNLEQRGITEAVTINGLLDPIERQKACERVADGSASLLYLSPESLRSKTIMRLLSGRNIARFVIDEAHCFSAWGQDFRVDYLYIAESIRQLQKLQKNRVIPISCFTATAKPQVIEDIKNYFQRELNLDLQVFQAAVARKNLSYQVLPQKNDDERYQSLHRLIDEYRCPTIVYVSRTRKTEDIAAQLRQDGFAALAYHGKMPKETKIDHQNQFMMGEVNVMVATSAFGMGVDKKDVGLVVHYEISDSLENYVQEAGRAGRDEQIQAACFVLFQPDDLDKHFTLLNQTKIGQKEIGQIWKALKDLFGKRTDIAESPLNIARQAGWSDEREDEIETRVKTAIAALEQVSYIKRGKNMPRVYANSILSANAAEAIDKINQSTRIHPDQKNNAIRIIKKLFSQRSQNRATEETAESRVDYIADVLGLKTETVVKIVSWLREEQILADQQDLRAYVRPNASAYNINQQLNKINQLEKFLLDKLQANDGFLIGTLKSLNQECSEHSGSLKDVNPKIIKSLLHFWRIKNWLTRTEPAHDEISLTLKQSTHELRDWIARKHQLAQWLMGHLHQLAQQQAALNTVPSSSDFVYVEFSIGELKQAFLDDSTLEEWEDVLFFLLRMDLLKIEGGFLVVYQRLSLKRLMLDNRKLYTKDDYRQLAQYYETRKQQIHIVGKYAKMMTEDVQAALKLITDYFSLDYRQFLRQYFPANEADILKLNMTNERFQKWFGNLSPTQLQIIQDDNSKHIVVFAAPGSGKTRVLVHKLASLYQLEDVKHEQLLMLTFSRAAAYEFKSRLFELMGNAAAYVEIKTFHSYCFDLLGRVGDLKQSDDIIEQAVAKIRSGEVENNRIAKLVLVLDEAQDINAIQFELVKTLMAQNEEMRVIAVGDDDQTIYSFAGATPKYMQTLLTQFEATKYELLENYRSKRNIVQFCNRFADLLTERLKNHPVIAVQPEAGEVRYVAFSGGILPNLLAKIQAAYKIGQSVALLTQTNEEAIWLSGQLRQAFIPCKLVQNNDGFLVRNLLEVAVFEHFLNFQNEQNIISQNTWDTARTKALNHFQNSSHLPLLINLLDYFTQLYPKQKYVSDWVAFTHESRLEDFYCVEKQQVFVSTIHKAKGREYDHVFVYLNAPKIATDEEKRVLYVAFSRAKSALTVFSNAEKLRQMCIGDNVIEERYHGNPQEDNRELALYLGHKDVHLGKFQYHQNAINHLYSGQEIAANSLGCFTSSDGEPIVQFSKNFQDKLNDYLRKGYRVIGASVNFIVMWKNPNTGEQCRIVLPIVYLER